MCRQRSYLTDKIKKRLAVKPKGRQEMSILTFGSAKEKPQSCVIIEVGVHTKEGSPILLRLLSVPLIYRVLAVPVEFCRDIWLFEPS